MSAVSTPSTTFGATMASATPSATPASSLPCCDATPAAMTKQVETCIEVSVEGDATYRIRGGHL
ncbi:hypothetical protein GN958_ATG12937 [Phytophthora infestans]|uniref:Uncharacterized protein n=1 Tax=Phytophthora infestans TaxID=4787 RepID=A0A8S9UGB0_PHYIN|nr:hypothetical protein GN958_ATG12937 [Phytophthora infestans]